MPRPRSDSTSSRRPPATDPYLPSRKGPTKHFHGSSFFFSPHRLFSLHGDRSRTSLAARNSLSLNLSKLGRVAGAGLAPSVVAVLIVDRHWRRWQTLEMGDYHHELTSCRPQFSWPKRPRLGTGPRCGED